MKNFLSYFTVLCLALLITAACTTHKPKKRSLPKKGPIPCPVKDC
jgi:hypothetical protein